MKSPKEMVDIPARAQTADPEENAMGNGSYLKVSMPTTDVTGNQLGCAETDGLTTINESNNIDVRKGLLSDHPHTSNQQRIVSAEKSTDVVEEIKIVQLEKYTDPEDSDELAELGELTAGNQPASATPAGLDHYLRAGPMPCSATKEPTSTDKRDDTYNYSEASCVKEAFIKCEPQYGESVVIDVNGDVIGTCERIDSVSEGHVIGVFGHKSKIDGGTKGPEHAPLHTKKTYDDSHIVNNTNASVDTESKKTIYIRVILKRMADFTLLKEAMFLLFILYSALTNTARITMITQIVSASIHSGSSPKESAYLPTIMGFANLVLRLFSTVVMNFKWFNPLWYTCAGSVCMALSAFVAAFTSSYPIFALSMVLLGVYEG